MKKAHNFIDLTGQKFNRWTLVEYLGNGKYLGRCECGTEKVVRGVDIKRGKSKSCGCLKKESSTKTIQKQNEKQKGENHPFYGKRLTQEHKRKISDARKGKCVGELNPNYNTGITDEERENRKDRPYIKQWQREVKHQANYTCDICGKRGNGTLHSHHLDSYNSHEERRLDITNGVCLCEHCHRDFHHYYGYGENTEEDYLEYKFAYQNN